MGDGGQECVCEVCNSRVDVGGGHGFYECDRCGQEVCSSCCDDIGDELVCDDCWPLGLPHTDDNEAYRPITNGNNRSHRVYTYAWGNNEKRATMKGRTCRVVARGRMNSVMIEFTDNGQREITSRNALRVLE